MTSSFVQKLRYPHSPDSSASVSSILRLWAFVTRDYSSPDLTYTTANPAIWSCVEASIAITSACLPSLRPVFAAMGTTYSNLRTKYPKSRSSSSRRTVSSRNQSKAAVGGPQLREASSETSDKIELRDVLNMHHRTDLPIDPETSPARSDDCWISQSGLPQSWDYPSPLNIRKSAGHT